MHSLEYLKQRAMLALRFRDLIGLAAYSKTPSTAYTAATKLGWRETQAASCRFLAIILRDYGNREFRRTVGKRAADRQSGDLCLCKCHLNSWSMDKLMMGGHEKAQLSDYDCRCCHHTECFHAAHTFCRRANDCPICYDNAESYDAAEHDYYDGDNDEGNDNDCDECGCSDCGGGDCGDCDDSPCENCGGGDCERCDCCQCGGENEDNEDEDDNREREQEEERSPMPVPVPKTIKDIAEKIQKVAKTNFPLEIQEDPDVNGWADGEKIYVTKSAEFLEEHEKASLIAHEVAHNELEHRKKREQRAEEAVGRVRTAINESKGFLKTILTGAIVTAGEVVKARAADRDEEYEADDRAKEIVKEAGYDNPADLLRKIDPMQQGGGVFISTHPPTSERIRRLEKK